MEDPQARVQIKQVRAELAQLAELCHKLGEELHREIQTLKGVKPKATRVD